MTLRELAERPEVTSIADDSRQGKARGGLRAPRRGHPDRARVLPPGVGGGELDAPRTTPEAPELQQMLRDMLKEGCGACVMEVSSHALALRRADDLRFAAGIFTNLTRDHLDFHGDMESYFVAKRRLFEILPDGAVGVVNVDDRRGADLAAAARRPVTYPIDAAADLPPGPLSFSLESLSFEVRTPPRTLHVRSPLAGRPNAYNILPAPAAASALA